MALMFYPIGYPVGSVTGAFLIDQPTSYIDIILSVISITSGLCMSLIPWVPSLGVVALLVFVSGFAQGSINAGWSLFNLLHFTVDFISKILHSKTMRTAKVGHYSFLSIYFD